MRGLPPNAATPRGPQGCDRCQIRWLVVTVRFTAPCYEADGAGRWANVSIYFSPDPVLKRTTVSAGLRNLEAISLRYATRQAAPSGAAKIPSVRAHSRMGLWVCS